MGVLTSSYAGVLTMVVMLVIGSTLRLTDLVAVFKRPRALLVGLAGQQVLVPIVGLTLASGLGGSPCLALAIVALVPGGAASTILTAAAGGNTALSAVLTLCSNVMVAIWVPLLLAVATGICGTDALAGDMDFAGLALRLALVSALPLLAGMVAASLFPRLMGRMQPYLAHMASAIFVIFVAWILWDDRANLVSYVSGAGLLVPVQLLLCGTAAWLAARLFRFGTATRTALLFEWGVQNVPLAILVALSMGATSMALPSAAYGLQQLAVGLVLALILRQRARAAIA